MTMWQNVNLGMVIMYDKTINNYYHKLTKIISAFIHGLFAVWVCLALWVHLPLGVFTYVLMLVVACLWVGVIGGIFNIKTLTKISTKTTLAKHKKSLFWVLVAMVLVWFLNLTPSNDRAWQDEFEHQFTYTQQGNLITINHVRNFYWHDDTYDKKWESRQYDLTHLNSLDMISTTWGNDDIAHIMVSFGFDDGLGNTDKLVLSVETRKEVGEEFSTIGGFFRMYDLSIIAGDEKDLIYTRSNVRGEQVYVYPITANANDIQKLFLTYLNTAKSLHNKPRWYNTLFSNCTTVIYQLIETIAPNQLPKDYRILLAGQLPSYLSQHQLLDNKYSPDEWKKLSYANPKVSQMNIGTPSLVFSQAIRNYDENLLIDNASK